MSILSSEVCKHYFQEVPPRPSISQPHAKTLTTTKTASLAAAKGTPSQFMWGKMILLSESFAVNVQFSNDKTYHIRVNFQF